MIQEQYEPQQSTATTTTTTTVTTSKELTTSEESSINEAFHSYVNDFDHIEDPLERRRLALEKIDNSKFGWSHVRTIIIAGIGFLTDSYDIFAINMGISILSYVYWQGNMPGPTSTLLKVSTSVGTVVGQVAFGIIADVFGRKKIYGLELILVIICSVLQCTIGSSPGVSFVAVLTFYRVVMGIGIGGDYPLSSIITSEFSTTKWRGAIMGAVFANQAWGQLAGGVVALIIIAAYKNQLIHANSGAECDEICQKACDQMWRLLIGFGAVPGVVTLYYRLTISESPRYVLDIKTELPSQLQLQNNPSLTPYTPSSMSTSSTTVPPEVSLAYDKLESEKNATVVSVEAKERTLEACATAAATTTVTENNGEVIDSVASGGTVYVSGKTRSGSLKDFCHHFGQWKYGKILLGTAGCWFMLDVAFYGLSLNTAIILQTIGFADSQNVYKKLYNSAVGNLILVCAGSLPGYWMSVFTIDTIGRKPIQYMGFVMLTILLAVIGFAYDRLGDKGLLALYVLCQFFQNFGPNVTTFIIPGEVFPTRYRSTAHGISAASGKIGAIIAQTALGGLINHNCAANGKAANCWLPNVMKIFARFMLVGTLMTCLIPETKRMTLEEISEKYHGEIDPLTSSSQNASATNRDNAAENLNPRKE